MAKSVVERLAVVETELVSHVKSCEARAARLEKWLRGVVIGVGLLVLEALLRFFFHG